MAADLTGLAAPRLVCAIHGEAEMPATLVLGRHRSGLRGTLRTSMGTHPVESVHRLEGSRISNADPVGYSIGGEESTVAAVEVVNRGYVWIAPAAGHDRAALAAAAAALLLFEPDIGPD